VETLGQLDYEQLNRLAETITQDSQEFDHNIYAQQTQMEQIRRAWPNLSESNKKYTLQKFALLFPRTREDPYPQDCLGQIIRLPSGVDVQRALRVRNINYLEYRADTGEDIYPSGGWLGSYLDYARWNKVPLALHFWAALSILGAAVRRNYYIDNNAAYLWMNQFIVLTGAKANGKSTARSAAKDILVRLNRKLAEMQDGGIIPNARSFQIPMMASDITPQGIIKELATMSGTSRYIKLPSGQVEQFPGEAVAIQISDELSNTLGRGTFGSPLRVPLYTELAFEDSYHKATAGEGSQTIERMALSVLGCTQPGWMRNTIVSDALEGGFVERANFIYRPESTRMYPMLSIPIIDPVKAEALADFLLEVSVQPPWPQLLQPTPQGKVFFDGWYERAHKRGPRDKNDASLHSLERRCIHLLRIAGLLCISERETLPWIQIEHLQKAIQIVEAEDKHYAEFIAQAGESTESQMCREVLAWVESQGGHVTKQAYGNHRKFGRSWDMGTRQRVIDNLIDTGQVVVHKKGGRTWYAVAGSDFKP